MPARPRCLLALIVTIGSVGTALTASAATVKLAWDPNPISVPALAGYKLYYGTTQGSPPTGTMVVKEGASPITIPLASLADQNAPTFTVTGVPSCVHVHYVLTAYDTAGAESGFSNGVDDTAADKPVATVVGGGTGALAITWGGLAAGDTGKLASYRVHYDVDAGEPYQGTGATQGASPLTVPASTKSYQLTGLPAGSTLHIAVEAVCADGTGKVGADTTGIVPGGGAVCGNSKVETGETCDPVSSCPKSCDDGNSCTTDLMTGSAASCTAACGHTTITACKGGDGCCPPGCTSNSDSDCSASCGNGTVEKGETCDPVSSCPTSCGDGNSCTTDVMTGSAATCSAACSHATITACKGGDSCCPPGCTSNSDSDCSASCGNGTVEKGETCDPVSSCPKSCDDGNSCTNDQLTGSAATCSAACSHATITACKGGDGCCPPGCTSNSDSDCSASCGNGTLEAGETCDPPSSCPTSCDDGNSCTQDMLTGSAQSCNAACGHSTVSSCQSGDGCCPPGCDHNADGDCSASCGNGTLEAGETCDPPSSCPTSCDDGDACTVDGMTGSAASCSAVCTHGKVVTCQGGDGCCPAGCDVASDSDCGGGPARSDGGAQSNAAHGAFLTGGCQVSSSGATGLERVGLLLLGAFFLVRRRGSRQRERAERGSASGAR